MKKILILFTILIYLFFGCFCALERNRGNRGRNGIFSISGPESVSLTSWRIGDNRLDYEPYVGRSVGLSFSNEDGLPTFSVKRLNRIDDTVTGLYFRFGLLALVEYIENYTDFIPGYDNGDTLVQAHEFIDPHEEIWGDLIAEERVADDLHCYIYNISTLPTSQNPPLILTFGAADMRGYVRRYNLTLAATTWGFGLQLLGFSFLRTDSNLALSAFLEIANPMPIFYNEDIPVLQRDDPTTTMDDILFSTSPSAAASSEDDTDIGYISWDRYFYPLTTQVDLSHYLQIRSVIWDQVLPKETTAQTVTLLNRSKLPNSNRTFLSFGLGKHQYSSLSWYFYLGLDEDDPPNPAPINLTNSSSTLTNYFCIYFILYFLFIFR